MLTLCSHPHVLDLFKVANAQVSHFTESHVEMQFIRQVFSLLLHPGQTVPVVQR